MTAEDQQKKYRTFKLSEELWNWTAMNNGNTGTIAGKIRDLAAAGADVNLKYGKGGKTPLIKTVENENIAGVAALIEKGAQLDATDSYGRTALYFSFRHDHPEIRKILTTAMEEQGLLKPDLLAFTQQQMLNDNLARAIIAGKSDAIIDALDKGGDPYAKLMASGENALTIPMYYNRPETIVAAVSALLAAGVNPDKPDSRGYLPITLAAAAYADRQEDLILSLLGAGANVNGISTAHGKIVSALHYAAANPATASLLLALGADPELPGSNGQTPRDLAASLRQSEVVKKMDAAITRKNLAKVGELESRILQFEQQKTEVLPKKNSARKSGKQVKKSRGPGK